MAECEELSTEARKICLIANNVSEAVDPEYQSVVSQVSIETGPFASQKTNRIKLGPFVKPEFVKELLPFLPSLGGYPDTPSLPPFIYTPHEMDCPWAKAAIKPINGWTTSQNSLDWFNRFSSRHGKWKSQRIYEFLKLSTYTNFPFDGVLSASLLSCWNPCLNVFITGQGPMTVTLEDIAYITGLSPSGIELPYHKHVEGALDIANIPFRKGNSKVVSGLSYSYLMNKYKGSTDEEVTREEEILFINFSLCKMLMGPSLYVHRNFLVLAANIEASPADKPLALGPFLLAQFYRCMYKLRTSTPLLHAGGPLWLLTFWGFLYFPSLVSIKSPEEMEEAITNDECMSPSSACCYGEVATLLLSVPSRKTVADILPKLLDPEPPSGSMNVNWHPCSTKDEMDGPLDSFSSWAKFAVPLWLRKTNRIMFKSEDSAHWKSVLAQRDLLYVGQQTIGVEVYNPNLVARQFGMIQACAIPLYQTQNRPWGARLEFLIGHKNLTLGALERKYFIEKDLTSFHTMKIANFNIQPWYCSPDIDDGFDIWWKDFWKRHEKAKTFITNQQIIIKALDGCQSKTDTLDPSQIHIGTQRETEASKDPSPQDSLPSGAQILKLKVDQNAETVEEKVVEEEADDLNMRQSKRPKYEGMNGSTPMSPDHASDARSMRVLPSSNGIGLQADNTAPDDSFEPCGKLSARIQHLLQVLSPSPTPSIPTEDPLLDTLERLVNDSENSDRLTKLIGIAQDFTEISPASYQSTVDHLKKSVTSIQQQSFKLKNQGPQLSFSVMKKRELTDSMERKRLEVEKKVEGARTLRKTHDKICRQIEIVEAELMQLKQQRDVIRKQLADADNEAASLPHELDESLTSMENEAVELARAESMKASWDGEMKVFKSTIVAIIEQLPLEYRVPLVFHMVAICKR